MPAHVAMHDPDVMDPPDKPFSYFAHPNDVLGVFGAPVASEVTPEGYIFTGFGELMFFVGNPPEPVRARIRTLHRGYLPIIEYDLHWHGVRYDFQLFAADLGGGLSGLPVYFVQVTLTNKVSEPRAAWLSAAWRYASECNTGYTNLGDFRFGQAFENLPRHLVEGQTCFNPNWKYRFEPDALIRAGRLIYCFPADPRPVQQLLALRDTGLRMHQYLSGEVAGDPDPTPTCDPHTPLGVVTHRVRLEPGESGTLVYKLPIVPLPQDSAEARQVREADCQEWLQHTIGFWEDRVARRCPLHLPERKAQEYLLANTITNLLAVDRIGEDTIVNVNKFHYHDWYGGSDPTHMMRAMEYMGVLDVPREGFLFWRKKQHADGSFRMQNYPEWPYWELFGWNLWGWAGHYRLTRDRAFLEAVYPGVVDAVAWHQRVTDADPLGLWPAATIADDALLMNCRQTGQHLWALVGLRCAAFMAREMGRSEDEERFRAQERKFRTAFEAALARQTEQTGGYIPPALDRTTGGNDWDNLLTLYPEVLFDPADPRVEATLRTARSRYQEGILQYVWPQAVAQEGDTIIFDHQPRMHYWQTPNNAQTSLVRGTPWDQEWALRELYALLLHTTSTHLPGEFGTIPWSTRECSHCFNLLPQGVTSAKTIELLRNMLVREQEDDLYLLSAVSPAWVTPGQVIRVENEPTAFGPVSFTVTGAADRLTVCLPGPFRNAPDKLLVRVPWYWMLDRAELDGMAVSVAAGHIVIPPGARELVLYGAPAPDTPALSYEQAVADYKTEYRRRYESWLRGEEMGQL